MNFDDIKKIKNNSSFIGTDMYKLIDELFPICRSITGNGVRQTLEILKKIIDIEIHEIPTKTKVFDWEVPKEWNISDAYIMNEKQEKIVDFKNSNLHVMSYSTPINKKISLSELKNHIHTIPEKPELIPYVTSYYDENWGFCMSQNDFFKLTEENYHVVIDSTLKPGHLTYGELFIPGKSTNEILLSCYICHPSMCNDNLSGIVLLTYLANSLKNLNSNYSYRFLFIPETIGSITWLFINQNNLSQIKHGLVATCIGDSGNFTYKKTRQNNAEIDNVVKKVLSSHSNNFKIVDFFPWGSDERQFCSPGFNLPVGSLMRSMYGTDSFPEYHTSADNLSFMKNDSLRESFSIFIEIIYELEKNFSNKTKPKINYPEKNFSEKAYLNLFPKCEPHLRKSGLYRKFGGQKNDLESRKIDYSILWILNLSDGQNSLRDISEKSGIDFSTIENIAKILEEKAYLKRIDNINF